MENPWEYDGFSFTVLHPTQLPAVFQLIEPGLLETQRKARLDWDVMILPTLISNNQATLTVMHRDDDRFAGFVITQSVFLGTPNKHYLKVIAAYVEIWCHQQSLDGVAAIDAFVTEFAKQLKCRGIVESARRPGWVRRLTKLNYTVVEETMMKLIE